MRERLMFIKNSNLKAMIPVALCTAFLAGCGVDSKVDDPDPNIVTEPTEASEDITTEPEIEDDTKIETAEDIFGKVSAITVVDLVDDMYEEPLEVKLTSAEVAAFMEIHPETNTSDKALGHHAEYSLQLYDESGNEAERLTVLSFYTVADEDGNVYNKTGEFETWLNDIELSHDLSVNGLHGRKPGDDYFILLSAGAYGMMEERRETNFDEGLEADLTAEDIAALGEALEGVSFSDTTTDMSFESKNYKYTVEIFDEHGADLYILRINENGDMFNGYGYEIIGGSTREWYQDMLDKYDTKN